MDNPLPNLQPGDHLIYGPASFMGWVIAVKTWSRHASHIEIYEGDCKSVASRDGKGVGLYPFRRSNLSAVLRPNQPFYNFNKAMHWFAVSANGQKYDWLGLLCFTLAVKQGSRDRAFCSEFATRFDREAGFHPFHPDWDADKVAPGSFLMSPAFICVWKSHDWDV